MFAQFETNEHGQQLIPAELGDKVALHFIHLTPRTQKYYNEFKVLPPWASVFQKDPSKVLVQKRMNGDYKWTGIKVKHVALKPQNLFHFQYNIAVQKQDPLEIFHTVDPAPATSKATQNTQPQISKRSHPQSESATLPTKKLKPEGRLIHESSSDNISLDQASPTILSKQIRPPIFTKLQELLYLLIVNAAYTKR